MQVIEKIFHYYFENERDIANIDTLVEIGEACQLTNVREFLLSNQFVEEVQTQINYTIDQQIGGVPFFIIDNQLTVSGAQETEYFCAIFKKLKLL